MRDLTVWGFLMLLQSPDNGAGRHWFEGRFSRPASISASTSSNAFQFSRLTLRILGLRVKIDMFTTTTSHAIDRLLRQ